jgi:lysophospholipase L1-like esterase
VKTILTTALALLLATPASAACVGFYGDSMLTAEPDGGDSLATKLEALRQDLTVYDQAAPGQNTEWLADNAKTTMQQHPTCKYVILAGTNDLAAGITDPQDSAQNIRSIAAKARTHAAGEIILTPLPVGCGSPANEHTGAIGNWLYWRNGSGTRYTIEDARDLYPVPGWMFYNHDCTHLNNAGRDVLAAFLAEVIP